MGTRFRLVIGKNKPQSTVPEVQCIALGRNPLRYWNRREQYYFGSLTETRLGSRADYREYCGA